MINIISGIAATGVAVGTFAMIIVLSAFNGLETLVSDMYASFDPDIRITPTKGKTMELQGFPAEEVAQWESVAYLAPVLEETVFLQYRDQQTIVTIKGVPKEYLPLMALDTHVVEGEYRLGISGLEGAILGYGIADNLNLFISSGYENIKVFAAKRDGINSANPQNKFVTKTIVPTGIVAVNPEFDFKYFITSFDFAQDLLQYDAQASSIELKLDPKAKPEAVKARLSKLLGPDFVVKTRVEMNEIIYKTNQTEKWITFFILSFILIVATFNLIGSLTMLIMEKRKDTSLLRSLGTTIQSVRMLFLFEGLLITLLGISVGLGLGVLTILAQQYIGLFALPGGIVEYYPVEFRWIDIVAVFGVVMSIGLIASLIPVRVLLSQKRLQAITG